MTRLDWKSWLDAALGFFYPEACQFCGAGRAKASDGFVCGDCRQQVRYIGPPFCEKCGLPFEGDLTTPFQCSNCHDVELHFSRARAAVAARGLLLDAIHRYKYHRALWFEPFLGELLARQAGPSLRKESWDMIVPVPLHPLKEREREFNQSARLGRCLARATGLPLNGKVLRRVQPTRTQTLLSRTERADNVRAAFAVNSRPALKGARIVLVDDVLTTGATTNACARELRRAGAAEVCVWTLARGL